MEDNSTAGLNINIVALLLNLLTVLVLLATVAAGLVLGMVFLNPYMSINPYPPPTLPATLGYPTATNTPQIYLPPTWTSTVTLTPVATATATATLTPTETPVPTEGTQVPTATTAPYSFQARPPIYMQNSFVNGLGCQWMGVGGQVFDRTDAPIVGMGVHVEGQLGDSYIVLDTLSGSVSVLGPSGYVVDLADHPIASKNVLWIQLNDGTTGMALSEKVYLETHDTCEDNFVLVIWEQVQ